jgi:trimeric autotransporter adhesin
MNILNLFARNSALLLVFCISTKVQAQIGIGTTTPNSSALLDISSNNKGLLVPRMTAAQRSAISLPATSLMIYQTDGQAGFYYNSGTPGLPNWTAISTASTIENWTLIGNSGTNAGTNFIGTTDGQNFTIKTNSIPRLTFFQIHGLYFPFASNNNSIIGNSSYLPINLSGGYNTFIGSGSGFGGTTGALNTAVGFSTLFNNTTGGYNTVIGEEAMTFNSAGSSNVAIGSQALRGNTTGYSNVAIGTGAMVAANMTNTIAIGDSALYNYTFDFNGGSMAIGSKALFSNTTGYRNTAIGYRNLYFNITGSQNTSVGALALYNTLGDNNVGVGNNALYSNTSGSSNTAIGYAAMSSGANTNTGDKNSALGYNALGDNSTGSYNVAVGYLSVKQNTTGSYNTGVGYQTINRNTTGTGNSALGQGALFNCLGGNYNTAVGYNADMSFTTAINSTAIGYQSIITASDQVRIGNAVTSIGGPQNWTNISDGRIKINIKENVPGIAFITLLRPVTYQKSLKLENQVIGRNGEMKLNKDNNYEKMLYTGFIAQEVEAAAKLIGYDFSGVDAPKNEKDLYGLRYAEFVVPLVKAVQEQQILIQNLQKQILELNNIITAKK